MPLLLYSSSTLSLSPMPFVHVVHILHYVRLFRFPVSDFSSISFVFIWFNWNYPLVTFLVTFHIFQQFGNSTILLSELLFLIFISRQTRIPFIKVVSRNTNSFPDFDSSKWTIICTYQFIGFWSADSEYPTDFCHTEKLWLFLLWHNITSCNWEGFYRNL